METISTWKKLVIQALKEIPIKTDRQKRCTIFNIQNFIYRALRSAGIQNRSPFSMVQLIRIRYRSKGVPELVRGLCIQTLQDMQKPAMGFQSAYTPLELGGYLIIALMTLAPQTATTFKTSLHESSILKIMSQPMEEIIQIETFLPTTQDNFVLPNLAEISTPTQPLGSGMADKYWIAQQQDSSYSLQLLSSSSTDSLQLFCKKHKICDQSAFYETRVNDKKIVRLLYGVYPSHAAAKHAINQLPEILKKKSPWTRKFEQIKQEI